MGESLDYEATLRALRRTLGEAAGNARAFRMRAGGRPELISSRTWSELSEIETVLAGHIQTAIRRELKAEPMTSAVHLHALWCTLRGGLLAGESALIARVLRAVSTHPSTAWRRGAPQLEASLWPFLDDRNHYLANTLALALNEPGPFPPIIWNPASRSFRS